MDGQDFRSGFAEAAGLAAIAAVEGRTQQSVPTRQPGGLSGEAGQWGMGGLKALHDHLHCSEGTPQEDIQGPGSRGKTDICSISKSTNLGCEVELHNIVFLNLHRNINLHDKHIAKVYHTQGFFELVERVYQ